MWPRGDVKKLCQHTRELLYELDAAGEVTNDLLANLIEALKEALIRIKRYLSQNEIRDVSIGDCFSNDLMDKARALGRMGAAQRREGVILKYRVMNRMGDAVMQTMKKGEPFKDAEVTEADLQPFSRAKPTVDTMEIDQQAGTSSQKGQPTGARPKQPPLPQPRSSNATIRKSNS